jgi:hypothetical protein
LVREVSLDIRRERSFSRHFIVIQSRSPVSWRLRVGTSTARRLADSADASPASELNRVLGLGGSVSQIVFRIPASPAPRSASMSNGRTPTSIS